MIKYDALHNSAAWNTILMMNNNAYSSQFFGYYCRLCITGLCA